MTLPPDLDRLGSALTNATARAVARRRVRAHRRRRIAGGLAAGLLVFAAVTPTHLGPADRPDFLTFAVAPDAQAAMICDVPRGQHFHFTEACVEQPVQPQAAR